MSFADPQTIVVATVDKVCNRIKSVGPRSTYKTSDEEYTFTISHQESKGRTRRMVRLDRKLIAADPLTAVNEYKTAGVYIVVDEPDFGFIDATLDHQIDALVLWLTPENIGKLLGSES